ncbi:MAG: FMN-binding protein [Ruminococcus sp.]|nr:FMN-binding protein [Ruminococcus sp.]
MKNNTFKEIIMPIIVLTCICFVVTAALAYINLITAPVIKAADEKAAAEARAELLSEADSFTQLDTKGLPGEVTEAYKADNGTGYVFMLTTKGYGGDIRLICGIKSNGSIEKTKTLSHSETSGIGSRVVDNDSKYKDQYVGKTADNVDEVDAVSGATISSKAYKKAIDATFEAYDTVKGAE